MTTVTTLNLVAKSIQLQNPATAYGISSFGWDPCDHNENNDESSLIKPGICRLSARRRRRSANADTAAFRMSHGAEEADPLWIWLLGPKPSGCSVSMFAGLLLDILMTYSGCDYL